MFVFDAIIACVTTGASGTVHGAGQLVTIGNTIAVPAVSNAAVVVNLTAALALDVQLALDASHANNAFQGISGQVTLFGADD